MDTLQDLMRLIPRCAAIINDKQCARTAHYHLKVKRNSQSIETDMCRVHIDVFTRNAEKAGATVERLHEWTSVTK